jgi:hypothetical protein
MFLRTYCFHLQGRRLNVAPRPAMCFSSVLADKFWDAILYHGRFLPRSSPAYLIVLKKEVTDSSETLVTI